MYVTGLARPNSEDTCHEQLADVPCSSRLEPQWHMDNWTPVSLTEVCVCVCVLQHLMSPDEHTASR